MQRKFLKPNENRPETFLAQERHESDYSHVVYNPYSSKSIQIQRERLPIFKYRSEIFNALENYQTVIVVGETGCGKTTQIPLYLMEWGWSENSNGKSMVGLVLPRRMATIKSAQRLAEESESILGNKVGYTIRFDSCFDPVNTRLNVMTRGILLREMLKDPLLSSYNVMIFDEAHERTAESDIIFGLIKKVLKKRPDFRLIVSSATLNNEHFDAFFDLKKYMLPPDKFAQSSEFQELTTTTIVKIDVRHHKNDIYYLTEPTDNYIEATATTIMDILKNSKYGDILAFLPGKEEIDSVIKLISDKLDDIHNRQQLQNKRSKYSDMNTLNPSNILLYPLYSTLPEKEQFQALASAPPQKRKCIVSTNIAEVSLTINDIVYVVDSGFEKIKYYDYRIGLELLGIHAISKSSAIQRAGRAGRTADGKVFRLYTEKAFNEMSEAPIPEIQRCDLAHVILQLKAFGLNPITFNYFSSPPSKNIISSLEALYFMGAIDKYGELTSRGKMLVEFPLPPNISCMILKGIEVNCLRQILYIAAMLQIKNIFTHNPTKRLHAETKKLCNFGVKEGDHLTYLNIFEGYLMALNTGKEAGFCQSNYINPKGLHRAHLIYKQLSKHLSNHRQEIIEALACSAADTDTEMKDKGIIKLDGGLTKQDLIDSFNQLQQDQKSTQNWDERFETLPSNDTILKCLVSGYFQNVACYNSIKGYFETLKNKYGPLRIHPDSVLYTLNPPPKYVIFNEIVFTSSAKYNINSNPNNISTQPLITTYMYDVSALPKNTAAQFLCREMPEYFIFGTPAERYAQQNKILAES